MSIKGGIKRVKRWCKEHERELVIGGVTAGIVVGTVVINKKFSKPRAITPPPNALPNNYGSGDIVMNLDDQSVTFVPMTSEVANGDPNYYRKKYSDIADALFDTGESTLNFVSDCCINRFTPFDDVGGEHDIAVTVLNEATGDILDNIDIDDIKAVQMLIDLK